MALCSVRLHASDTVEVRRVVCRPARPEPGAIEENAGTSLVLPLAGAFVRHVGRGREHFADATGAQFFRAGEPYRVSHPDPAGDVCLSIQPRGDFLGRLFEASAPERAAAAGEAVPAATRALPGEALALRSLLAARLARGRTAALEVEASSAELVAAALGRRLEDGAGRGGRRARGRERCAAARSLLAADPGRAWRLAELAREVGGSPFHLVALFREETGLPIHRYLTLVRLARACAELVETERSVTEIGMDLGFATPSHFASSFRRAVGVSPGALRSGLAAAEVARIRKILTARLRAAA